MTTKTVKVGDVVAWKHVPNMAMVKSEITGDTASRINGQCHYVASGFALSPSPWDGSGFPSLRVTIIALNLTGNETADELRALAEAFECDHPAA